MGIPVVIAKNGIGLPVRPVGKNAPSMTIAANGLGIPIVISNLGAPFVVQGYSANPLSPYYGVGPGKIAIHYATDAVTVSGGEVVALQNKGGAGAVFDATVDGTPIASDGNYLNLVTGGGRPQLANAADLVNVHLMMVVDMAWPATSFYRFIGSPDTFISRNYTSGLVSVGMTGFATRNFTVPVDLNYKLIEVIITPTSTELILDGVSYGVRGAAAASFPVSYIGRGSGGNGFDFKGRMGDVLGAGSAAAITAARAYLASKFGITLP